MLNVEDIISTVKGEALVSQRCCRCGHLQDCCLVFLLFEIDFNEINSGIRYLSVCCNNIKLELLNNLTYLILLAHLRWLSNSVSACVHDIRKGSYIAQERKKICAVRFQI